jgi:hypothetical protein
MLTDFILTILVFSLPLTFVGCILLLRRYRKRMATFMQEDSGYRGEPLATTTGATPTERPDLQLIRKDPKSATLELNQSLLRKNRLQLSLIYLVTAILYGVTYAYTFDQLVAPEVFPGYFAFLAGCFAFPGLLLTVQIWERRLWVQAVMTILIFFLPFMIFVEGIDKQAGFENYGFVIVWTVLFPYGIYGLVRLRQYRTIGPFVWAVILGFFTSIILALVLAAPEEMLDETNREGGTVAILIGLAVLVAYPFFARWNLRLVVGWYEKKRSSDWIIQADIVFLIFSLLHFTLLHQNEPLAGFIGLGILAGYKLLQILLMRVLIRPDAEKGKSLLLLRVFGHRKRSRQLLDRYLFGWRFQGPIHMIAGTDLASETIEPHEFLAFLGRKLNTVFVKNGDELQTQLANLDVVADPDGRYRVNDFFCFDNVWKEALLALLKRSDYVLMDLRGFGPDNQGCIFEIEQLLLHAPLPSLAFLINKETDIPFLKETFYAVWDRLPYTAENLKLETPQVNFYEDPKGVF